jgi:DNA primase
MGIRQFAHIVFQIDHHRQTRRLFADGTPKYRSSPGMPKDRTLFNHHPGRRTLIVESPMSVLSKWHAYPRISATFGASTTDRQCQIIGESDSVILWMDNDPSGWSATEQIAERVSNHCPVLVVPSPWAADVADVDDETFLGLLDEAVPYAVWKRPRSDELREWVQP